MYALLYSSLTKIPVGFGVIISLHISIVFKIKIPIVKTPVGFRVKCHVLGLAGCQGRLPSTDSPKVARPGRHLGRV